MENKERLKKIFLDTLAVCAPDELVRQYFSEDLSWSLKIKGRLFVFGAGKASAVMARGVIDQFQDQVAGGVVIVPAGIRVKTGPLGKIKIVHGSHPHPDEKSLEATNELLKQAAECRPDDHVIFLLSGGASALMTQPIDGLTVKDKAAQVFEIMKKGVPIEELNAFRKTLSKIKGGKLRKYFNCDVTVLVMSDVNTNSFSVIGSGPFATDDDSEPEHIMLATGNTMAHRAFHLAKSQGLPADFDEDPVDVDVEDLAEEYAELVREKKKGLHVCYGEPTVKVKNNRPGMGGRSQHLCLLLAKLLKGKENWCFLACGTDGMDGHSDAAGAVVDGKTWDQAKGQGRDGARDLREFDSYHSLKAAGALVQTGLTGNNLQDLHLLYIW